MAPALERTSGAGVAPVFLAVALVARLLGACGDSDSSPAAPPPLPQRGSSVADPAAGMHTPLDDTAPTFGDALLDELTGDDGNARTGFERVLAASDAPPPIAARAALHLARMEARAGKTRHALDLVARATSLAPSDLAVAEGAAQLESEVGARGASDIRGPRIGTALPGVDPKVTEEFMAAERSLQRVHRMRLRPFIESLSSSIAAKENATEDVAQAYRTVAEHGGLAKVASDYRIGTLYHDLATGLVFDLPPELDPQVAAGLRRTLAGQAVTYLKKAAEAYRACLSAPPKPEAEPWRLAAEADLRGALDLLGQHP